MIYPKCIDDNLTGNNDISRSYFIYVKVAIEYELKQLVTDPIRRHSTIT